MIKLDYSTMSRPPNLGYYTIGKKIYWDKASALIEGTKMGLKYHDLKWDFNDSQFSSLDWTIEPPLDIRSYYQKRAKQLREKYDYLILNFSGGSDSATVLYSFIQQGLFIDEVVVRHATSGTKKYRTSDKIFSAENEFSELEHAAIPILKWLEKTSPKTKITIHDFSKDIIDKKIIWDENFIHWTGDYVTPGCIVRYNNVTNLDHLKNFEKGKNIGIIFGVDKPRVIFQKEDVNVFFVDRAVHIALPSTVTSGFTNTAVELFFWSPDMPEIVVKQAHLIKRWFEILENQRHSYMLDFWWQMNPSNRTTYEWAIKGIIYPDYDLKTFQCNKPTKAMFQEWDYWMKDFEDSIGYNTFINGVTYLYNNIDSSFLKIPELENIPGAKLHSGNWEYRPVITKRYYLGKFKKNIHMNTLPV